MAAWILPISVVLILTSTVSAGCTATTTTLRNSGDVSAIASCSTFSGSIAIATDLAGNVAITGVEEITGNLTVQSSAELSGLSSTSLRQIGDTMLLKDIMTLSNLSFPSLTQIKTIIWSGLPNVEEIDFQTGISLASQITVSNTQISNLTGLNVQVVDVLDVNNNPYMETVSIPVKNVGSSLRLVANGRKLHVELSDLQWANNLTLQSVSFISMPSLGLVNNSLNLLGNYFSSFGIDSLSAIKGSLEIANNTSLDTLSFPSLLSVGTLDIQNNIQLGVINGFQELHTVGGKVDISGNLRSVDLPNLQDVKGALTIRSNNATMNCSAFDQYSANAVIKASYTCEGQHVSATATATPTKLSATGTSLGAGISTATKAGIGVGVSLGVVGVGVVTGLLFFRRRRQRSQPKDDDPHEDNPRQLSEKDGTLIYELGSIGVKEAELPTKANATELPEYHGMSEVGAERRFIRDSEPQELPVHEHERRLSS